MKLMIDNGDGRGPQDYTPSLNAAKRPHVLRKLNHPAELRFSLVAESAEFVVPVPGARVTLGRSNGKDVFAGYVAASPTYQYLGWTERGPVFTYDVIALSDEVLLDKKPPSTNSPFVARSAGDALQRLTEDMLPGWADYGAVEAGDVIPYYRVSSTKKWNEIAAELAVLGRCSYRTEGNRLVVAAVGEGLYELSEEWPNFSPSELTLRSEDRLVNDLAVLGAVEPNAHVRDYFVGDGFTTKFYLSQIPFTRGSRMILDEEYRSLDEERWKVVDPEDLIAVNGGKLQVSGGTGIDGDTRLEFTEKIELGGAVVLQHGDIQFDASSDGIIGGVYDDAVSMASCIAGFRVTPSGANSRLQSLVQGNVTGTALTTQSGHRYVLTTRVFADEVYRMKQVFHSESHPSGQGWGGEAIDSNVRVVLEIHDIDTFNPASQVAPATVLYDGVLTDTPGFVTYALLNSKAMHCSVSFTRISLPEDVLVRSTAPQQSPKTRRAGSLLEGADCRISEEPAVQFYPQYAPLANEIIEVTYRGRGRARARVTDQLSIAAHARGIDDGVRGGIREIAAPIARTSADCETAALALLEGAGQGWSGEYRAWSTFLPGRADDLFPGDGLTINVPSRSAVFTGILREVEIELVDLAEDNSRYTLRFVDSADPSLAFMFESVTSQSVAGMTATDRNLIGTAWLADIAGALVTNLTSTTVTIDTGYTPPTGEGIEVRRTDAAWGVDNDRNLIGRFTTRSFTLSRYGRVQDFFVRRYDSNSPARYSRYSGAIHVDAPL